MSLYLCYLKLIGMHGRIMPRVIREKSGEKASETYITAMKKDGRQASIEQVCTHLLTSDPKVYGTKE